MDKKTISIVIPVYNEKGIIKHLIDKLQAVLKNTYDFEFIFVNDGSEDGSLELLLDLGSRDARIKVIDLSRNFGHQIAVSAGIDYSSGDAVVLMDADMEDNPEDILKLIKKWEEGYDVVYVIRNKRTASLSRRLGFSIFHYLNKMIYDIPIEPCGIFGLMDRKAVEKIKVLTEQNRYVPGLRSWIGFKQIGIKMDRGTRYDRSPRVKFSRLISLAFDSYFSFSKKPLKIGSTLGVFFSVATFLAAVLVVILRLIIKFDVPGWASLIVVILFISSMQFICIGIIGEYLGRIYDETRRRPLYIVNKLYGIKEK
jgi:dolichol-phosphate mannosyltransferase